MSSEITEQEKLVLTPELGFNLVGIDPFEVYGKKLYLIKHYVLYQDALKAKKERKNPEEYLILYKGAS